MALNAERAKYGLPAEFKVTREMKKSFTPQEKVMYKCAYEVGGAGRANEVMRVYFAKKKAATARGAAGEASGASGAADPKPPEATPVPKAAPPTTPAAPVELTVVPPGETLPAGQLLYAGTIDWYESSLLGRAQLLSLIKLLIPTKSGWVACAIFCSHAGRASGRRRAIPNLACGASIGFSSTSKFVWWPAVPARATVYAVSLLAAVLAAFQPSRAPPTDELKPERSR
jgi:hypothetical protein